MQAWNDSFASVLSLWLGCNADCGSASTVETMEKYISILMAVFSILINLFEGKLGKWAKYLYVSGMPF